MARDKSGSAAKYHREVVEGTGTAHAHALELSGRDHAVLELGCAAGHVTRALVARGHRVTGVEIDPESAALAREVADEVITADLDRQPLTEVVPDRRFDVVLMGDVLEHLRDPLPVLQEAAAMLSPGGCVVVSVPNVAHADLRLALLDGEWEYHDDGLLDATHLRFFTRRSLFRFAEAAGLAVTELRRVTKAPGTSNVAPATPAIGRAARELVLLDPNATTYVFVARLEPATDEHVAVARALDDECTRAEDAAADHVRALLDTRARELDALTADRQELIAMKNSRLFRGAALPRRVYARLRRLLGR